MMIVVDANLVVPALVFGDFTRFGHVSMVAPPLLWPEVRSVLRAESVRSGDVDVFAEAFRRIDGMPIDEGNPHGLNESVWTVVAQLGWTKSFDAEYIALAQLLGVPLATIDRRMERGARRLGVAVWDFQPD